MTADLRGDGPGGLVGDLSAAAGDVRGGEDGPGAVSRREPAGSGSSGRTSKPAPARAAGTEVTVVPAR
ncbi:hypothetical protein ACFCVY_00315 [Streptomyces sp. NPDC056411]|uniref:hypothetical protein n=1 Tax=Streptomyces sp. NPDC056411 TaxID=3345813 RepID=UPI0035DF834D